MVLENVSGPLAADADGDGLLDECQAPGARPFQRGDASADGRVGITDAVVVLRFLFSGGAAPPCADAADADDDGDLRLTDALRVLLRLFLGGEPLPPPGRCGLDPTADELGCEGFEPCEARP
ncbi:MAG: hypothetical protein HY721_16610 [Planctomycetes bacterium]|nr:hypothetical protein [Planctomycetota bacterium]